MSDDSLLTMPRTAFRSRVAAVVETVSGRAALALRAHADRVGRHERIAARVGRRHALPIDARTTEPALGVAAATARGRRARRSEQEREEGPAGAHRIVELVTVMGVSSWPEICGYVGYQEPPVLSVIVERSITMLPV